MAASLLNSDKFLRGRTSFPFYFAPAKMFEELTDEELGRLTRALVLYAEYKIEPNFKDNRTLRMIFKSLRKYEDDAVAKYLEICRKNSIKGKKRKSKAAEQNSEEEEEDEEPAKMNVEEIDSFIKQEGLPFH